MTHAGLWGKPDQSKASRNEKMAASLRLRFSFQKWNGCWKRREISFQKVVGANQYVFLIYDLRCLMNSIKFDNFQKWTLYSWKLLTSVAFRSWSNFVWETYGGWQLDEIAAVSAWKMFALFCSGLDEIVFEWRWLENFAAGSFFNKTVFIAEFQDVIKIVMKKWPS